MPDSGGGSGLIGEGLDRASRQGRTGLVAVGGCARRSIDRRPGGRPISGRLSSTRVSSSYRIELQQTSTPNRFRDPWRRAAVRGATGRNHCRNPGAVTRSPVPAAALQVRVCGRGQGRARSTRPGELVPIKQPAGLGYCQPLIPPSPLSLGFPSAPSTRSCAMPAFRLPLSGQCHTVPVIRGPSCSIAVGSHVGPGDIDLGAVEPS